MATKVLLSPFRDMKQIGKGITNFFKKPTEGPLGIAEGTGGLVKNAISGTFGVTSNLTSTLSKGLLALSVDKEYIEKKEQDDEAYKPTNVFTGIRAGIFSATKSIFSGVSGIVTKPIEGASSGGVTGFIKGAGKGLAGAVTKPLSGGLDFFSKTAEGIKNTTQFFDKEVKQKERIRSPRIFYTSQKLIRIFEPNHSNIMPLLRCLLEYSYPSENLLDLCVFERKSVVKEILWISEEHVIFFHNNKIVLEIPTPKIQLIEIMTKIIIIYVSENTILNKQNLRFKSEKDAEKAYNKLNGAIKHNK